MNPLTEAELQAWVDGRLAAPRRADIDVYLETHRQEAQRLHAYRQQNAALRTLFNPVLEEAVPLRMRKPQLGAHWRAALKPYLAGVAIALAGGTVGWGLHGQFGRARSEAAPAQSWPLHSQQAETLARHAAQAHLVYSAELTHAVEVGADQRQHLVAWLSKRLGTQLRPPELDMLGYELIGGRLLPGDSGPVALFMYRAAGGERLTLYVSSGQSGKEDSGSRFAQEGPVGVVYWFEGSLAYALSGTAGKAALSRLANAVYQQLQHA